MGTHKELSKKYKNLKDAFAELVDRSLSEDDQHLQYEAEEALDDFVMTLIAKRLKLAKRLKQKRPKQKRPKQKRPKQKRPETKSAKSAKSAKSTEDTQTATRQRFIELCRDVLRTLIRDG